MSNIPLKVNDLFCGAGGMGLGFKQAGFRLASAWDFDKYAVLTYGSNVSPKVKQADITLMKAEELPYADVWSFGFPCQDLSVAGKQAGMIRGKTRSGLFYEVMRLLEDTRIENKPSVIVAENVKGVRKFLPLIEEEYAKQGYKLFYTLYNSKYWGVPQNRERYFMVGVRSDIELPFSFEEQDQSFVPKLSSVLEDNVDEKYYVSNEKAKEVIEQAKRRINLEGVNACITPDRIDKRQNGRRAKGNEEEMFTLTSQDRHGVIDVVGRLEIKGHDLIKRVYNPTGVSPTLPTSQGGNQHPKIVIPAPIMTDGTAYAVTTRTHAQPVIHGIDRKQGHFVFEKEMEWRVRRLTPREYARLQGFPDAFEQVVSDSQMYKQMGNAVTVSVAESIARASRQLISNIP